MIIDHILILFALFCLNIVSFVLGYILALITQSHQTKPVSFFNNKSQNLKANQDIQIDSKTYVTEIGTGDLEKKYTTLGEIKASTEDISGSINKLKNILKQ